MVPGRILFLCLPVLIYCHVIAMVKSTNTNKTMQEEFDELFEPPGPMETRKKVTFTISVQALFPILLNLIPKVSVFSNFNHHHMEAVEKIKAILKGIRDKKEALKMALALRDRAGINLRLWLTAFVSFSYLDEFFLKLWKPEPVTLMPDCFVPKKIIGGYGSKGKTQKPGTCELIDGTVTSDNGVESALWYFREDIWINTHHWYYHLAYPLMGDIPRADRRGELFYYMHHEVNARYNAERLCNGLPIVKPFDLRKGTIIEEGYNSHLTDSTSQRDWQDRKPNRVFADAIHGRNTFFNLNVFVNSTISIANLILKTIEQGFVIGKNNNKIPINNVRGVDYLGNLMEANKFSVNDKLYGYVGVHANGHIISSVAEDPNYKFKFNPGVMANTAVSMRDPFFYRWHGLIDEWFSKHKAKLTPYAPKGGELPLLWPNVRITNLKIVLTTNGKVNQLYTFWSRRNISFNAGLDFQDQQGGEVKVCVKHLDHEPFVYNFDIETRGFPALGPKVAIRIFMAPRFNEKGVRFTMMEQHRLFFVMDVFILSNLKTNKLTITRGSNDSNLVIPFQEQNRGAKHGTYDMPFCGCGWPRHMLLPRGTTRSGPGVVFDVFVMLSNGAEDEVIEKLPYGFTPGCTSATIMCGAPGQMYPLRKPMGYPFDRRPYSISNGNAYNVKSGKVVADLDEYVKGMPNMATFQVVIKFVEPEVDGQP